MDQFQVYKDIQQRTGGSIYIGVVGPVRTGKSTFVRHFMEMMALPGKTEEEQSELKDQLPLSGSGKLITTVEPKFIPKDTVSVFLDEEREVHVKLIDCVGFLVKDAVGNVEDGKERMVKTPWTKDAIPFHEAAEIGTRKVIEDHATIALVITTDSSFGEIPRENYLEAERKTISELKKQGKPFLVLLNSQFPFKEETKALVKKIEDVYQVSCLSLNCEQLRKDDITRILEKILYEFPLSEIKFYIPKWMEMLPASHEWKKQILDTAGSMMFRLKQIKDIQKERIFLSSPFVEDCSIEELNLADGSVKVRIQIQEKYYFRMLSEMSGVSMESEYDLIRSMQELAEMKTKYLRVKSALDSVKGSGYGVVIPELDEIQLEEPVVIRQGNKFGVKIRSKSPSVHMIRAEIETEIAPIVGTEQQAKDLIQYIGESEERGESIWQTNIFGKSLEQLIQDGIRSKISSINEESQIKLQNSMQKIVNDSKGGMVCIII